MTPGPPVGKVVSGNQTMSQDHAAHDGTTPSGPGATLAANGVSRDSHYPTPAARVSPVLGADASDRCCRAACGSESLPGLVTIVIPVYNESSSLRTVLDRVDASPIEKEIVVVDDGSDDGTREVLQLFISTHLTVIAHSRNWGKGAAIRTALDFARGEFVVIQDGDLEYDPADYPRLLGPLLAGRCDVVYGMRPDRPQRGLRFYCGAKFLTWITNVLYGAHLHDEATCYKAFRRTLLQQLALQCVRFEFCPEVTGKLLRLGCEILEVPISYSPRHRTDGKTVTVADGWTAVLTLLRVRIARRRTLTSTRPASVASLFPRIMIRPPPPRVGRRDPVDQTRISILDEGESREGDPSAKLAMPARHGEDRI